MSDPAPPPPPVRYVLATQAPCGTCGGPEWRGRTCGRCSDGWVNVDVDELTEEQWRAARAAAAMWTNAAAPMTLQQIADLEEQLVDAANSEGEFRGLAFLALMAAYEERAARVLLPASDDDLPGHPPAPGTGALDTPEKVAAYEERAAAEALERLKRERRARAEAWMWPPGGK